ncbi:MAG: phage protein Gp36 family protein [Polyangiales bacterium]
MPPQLLATLADLAAHGVASQTLAAIPDATRLEHLRAASGVAWGYLANRFTPPLLTWGTELTQMVCDIAAWTLLRHRGFDPDKPADKAVLLGYEKAVAWLKAFGNGRGAVLGYADSTVEPARPSRRSHLISRPRRGL